MDQPAWPASNRVGIKRFSNNPPPLPTPSKPFPFFHLTRRLSKKLKTQPNGFFIACFPAGPLAVIPPNQMFTTEHSVETGRLISRERLIFSDASGEAAKTRFKITFRDVYISYFILSFFSVQRKIKFIAALSQILHQSGSLFQFCSRGFVLDY